jgi:outer membrane protein assembly factor BamD
MVLKYLVIILSTLFLIAGCSGRKPEVTWTAEEYFQYALEMYQDEDYFEAINEFTIVILRYPGSTVADSAQFYLASCHYSLEEFIISAAEFSKLINNMPQSPLVPEAQFMLAESYYAMSPRPALDQEYSVKALREYQIFLEDFPRDPRREDAERKIYLLREKLAEKQLQNADLYRKMMEFNSSIIYYDIVLERYYDTEFADDALLGKALSYMEMEDYEAAKEILLSFKDKFPKSELIDTVDWYLKRAIARVDDDTEN